MEIIVILSVFIFCNTFIPIVLLRYEKYEINFELKLEVDKNARAIGYKDILNTDPHF